MHSVAALEAAPARLAPAAQQRPLRVALFSGNYNCVVDGANRALNRLVAYAEETQAARFRVYSPVVAEPAFPPAGDLVGVPSVGIPGRSEYRLAFGLPRRIRRDVLSFKPDIIHLSAPDLLGVAAKRLGREIGAPVVISLHTRFEKYLRHYGLGFLTKPVEDRLIRFYNDGDHVLAPNAAIAEELKAAGVTSRISVWGRGVDRTKFSPALRDRQWRRNNGYDDNDVVLLFFGRIVHEKGIAVFADVVDRLRARGCRLKPLIVGDGPARSWMADRLGEATFTGHLSGRALGRAVASADIMFNPSLTEAFGNVVLEAMASGLAVVSADTDSAMALINHLHTGLLIPDDVDAYVEALDTAIRSAPLRRRLGKAAAIEAGRYDWEPILAGVTAIYAGHAETESQAADLAAAAATN